MIDPEDSIEERLDAGPPPKPPEVVVTVSVTFEQIKWFFRKILERLR